MEDLLKIGEKTSRLDQEVEMSDFEKKLHFAKQEIPEFSESKLKIALLKTIYYF